MRKLVNTIAVAVCVGALAAPATALASGKLAGGGATGGGGGGSTTTTTTSGGGGTTSGGGGGTSGGGGGQVRGATDPTAPAPAPAPPPPPPGPACATFASTSAPVGYYLTWAALWNDYTVRSCSTGTQDVSVTVTNTNVATGNVDYTITVPYTIAAGQNISGVLDNDFAPFSTDYAVKMELRDEAGNLLDSSSLAVTTPPAR